MNTAAIAAVGYVARPLGSWLIGLYADRRGRKAALTGSVLAMSVGSMMIALTPGYASIGIFAPMVLIAARLLQGLSMGGEYGTSATYLSEIAPEHRKGFYLGFLQVSVVAGQLVALGLMLLFAAGITSIRTPTRLTHGSLRRCGRSRRLAGRTRPRTCAIFTRPIRS